MSHAEILDFLLRALTLTLLTVRSAYWFVTERRSNRTKPLLKEPKLPQRLRRAVSWIIEVVVYAQLLGFAILPFTQTPAVQSFGFLVVALGFAVSMSARVTIGANWAHGAEYQIKKDHELVTAGIYRYIRHPIYAGLFASLIGAEIVAGSIVAGVFLVGLSFIALVQAKKEEAILIQKFGAQYREYMARTKRFIPYVW